MTLTDRMTVQERIDARNRQVQPHQAQSDFRAGPHASSPPPPTWATQTPTQQPRRSVEHYDATPGLVLGAVSLVGGLFTAIPAVVMGVRGRRVAQEGGTTTNAGWALGLGIAGIVWASLVSLVWITVILATGAAIDDLDSAMQDLPTSLEQDVAGNAPTDLFGVPDTTCSMLDEIPVDVFGQAGFLTVIAATVTVSDEPGLQDAARNFDTDSFEEATQAAENDAFVAELERACS